MINVLIIGNFLPLQKLLPVFLANEKIELKGGFTDIAANPKVIEQLDEKSIDYFPQEEINNSISAINEMKVDWLFSINSTIILSKDILSLPPFGSLNFHPGPLPEYAGLHTHQWAIRNDENEFGVTIHWMEPGIDVGDIAFQERFQLSGKETGLSLFMKCLNVGVKLMQMALENISNGVGIPSIGQDLSKRKLYTHKMALDGEINWNSGLRQVNNFFRASNYAPFNSPTYTPYTTIGGKKIFVKRIENIDVDIEPIPGKFILVGQETLCIGTKDNFVKLVPNLKESGFSEMSGLIAFVRSNILVEDLN